MRYLLTFLVAWAVLVAPAEERKPLSVRLQQIDQAIAQFPEHVAQYRLRLAEAQHDYERAGSPEERYRGLMRLYELYKPFKNDSAMFCLREGIRVADELGNRSESVRCRILLAQRCSSTGMYDEAQVILDSIRPEDISRELQGIYYQSYNNVYDELAYYTQLRDMQQIYYERAGHYEALMFETLPDTCEAYLMRKELSLMNVGKLAESMRVNDKWLGLVEKGSRPYAMVALFRYLEFKMLNDEPNMMDWLCESVLADLNNAVMDQGSLWELANQLMLQGDIDRAYRYISFTSDCANHYGSRQRRWQIAPLMSEIADNYKAKSERTTTQLWVMLGAISILALLLMGVLFFLHRRNKQLDAARKQLHQTNDQLATLNGELQDANHQLSDTNAQFAILNSQLKEANQVKEEYIGRFLSLCSQYVDKLDDYRKMVNKKMKNKELDELFRISKSTEFKEKEIEELYQNFDSVFLHLFPNFIDDFNSLLQPEVQVHPKEENTLTTDIRIFALIRLGIDDSSKIAEFLHYSVNTIYNYRARIKNGAVGNREAFERQVKALGMPQ
ncbi:MAG: transcriptional regulator [Prevotella sp.]|nr:transcriptional regulator [Prevotella sp.]